MCTRVLWPDANGAAIVGRNMDFHLDLMTNLWKMPRGVERSDGANGKLKWKAKYGSVVATAFDLMADDGMNEKGLVANLQWLSLSDYGTPKEDSIQLSMAIWVQFYLDNFATVAEAVAWTEETQVEIVQIFDPTGHMVPALHLSISDPSGDSAVIEYIAGKVKVWHSPEYKVMTNDPAFNEQLALMKDFDAFGGDKPLPGASDPTSRFVRAFYYVNDQPQPKNQVNAMAAMLSIMHNAAQPFHSPDPGRPFAAKTIWQCVADMTNKVYLFESRTRPNIVWVDFKKISFEEGSKIMKLDLVDKLALEGGLAGDVSHQFHDPGEEVLATVDTGLEAIEFIAKKKREFAGISKVLGEVLSKETE